MNHLQASKTLFRAFWGVLCTCFNSGAFYVSALVLVYLCIYCMSLLLPDLVLFVLVLVVAVWAVAGRVLYSLALVLVLGLISSGLIFSGLPCPRVCFPDLLPPDLGGVLSVRSSPPFPLSAHDLTFLVQFHQINHYQWHISKQAAQIFDGLYSYLYNSLILCYKFLVYNVF